MGFLDKLIRGVNRAAEPIQNATTLTDPRTNRARRVAEEGEQHTGRIVGIQRRFEEDQTRTVVLVAPAPAPDGPVEPFAVKVGTTKLLHRLRLGLVVPIRATKRGSVIDWPALAAGWDVVGAEPSQEIRSRKLPAEGIVDTSHLSKTLKLLERGRRTTATITSLERVSVLGMATVNWDMVLTLPDGTTATRRKEEIPPYAWWYTGVGTQVEVAVDEKDPSKVAIDWPALVLPTAGSVTADERPPAGSVAAEVEASFGQPSEAMRMDPTGDARDVIAANRDVGQVNATLRSWIDEVHAGRMKPKAFVKHVAEWESAGMCTAEEAAAARAAAGIVEG